MAVIVNMIHSIEIVLHDLGAKSKVGLGGYYYSPVYCSGSFCYARATLSPLYAALTQARAYPVNAIAQGHHAIRRLRWFRLS